LPRANEAFDDNGNLKDPKSLARLEKLLTAFKTTLDLRFSICGVKKGR
jgi:hypothetical protein